MDIFEVAKIALEFLENNINPEFIGPVILVFAGVVWAIIQLIKKMFNLGKKWEKEVVKVIGPEELTEEEYSKEGLDKNAAGKNNYFCFRMLASKDGTKNGKIYKNQ